MAAVLTLRSNRGWRDQFNALIMGAVLVATSVGIARGDFNYPNFSSVAGLTLNGTAVQAANNLRLTQNLEGQFGSAWRTTAKAHVANGFDTTFTFQMNGDFGGGGGDGMAFVIQDTVPTALGGGGSGLGYASIARSVAVEIDTFGFDAETNNHISVQTAGANGNSSEDSFSLGQYNAYVDLNDGALHTLRIRYRPGFLLVFLDSIPAPVLNIELDLHDINGADILDGTGNAWVGFTAGTGLLYQVHEVTSWNFDEINDPLPSGGCCTLTGCVTSNARNCGPSLAGYYAGDNTDCGTVDCTGACCSQTGCSWFVSIQDCAAEPGTFMGVGSACPSVNCTGACCTPAGGCVIVTELDCLNSEDGVFHGAGTSCVPFPCSLPPLGGCCIDDECQMKTQAECATGDGVWYGRGSLCQDIECFYEPNPFGACCQPGGACVGGVTEAACVHFNGIYHGDDSLCANVNCGAACDCVSAVPITGTAFFDDSTTEAPVCSMAPCGATTGNSPAKIYAVTLANGGQCLINTCNGNNFNTVLTVHSGCPMTPENLVTCDDDDNCAPGSQVYFCASPGVTYYVRVGGVNGASGDYSLLVYDYGTRILEGPYQNPANNHWYYITATGTWTLNEQLAIAKGGHLATINNAAENEWVRSTFTLNGGVVIGINDAATEGTFVWPNGDPVTYTNWAPGQPDNAGGVEDYGFMQIDGTWLDLTNCPTNNSGEAIIEVNTLTLPGLIAGPILNPANCHNYYFTEPCTWTEAQLKAQALGGNLVTINNAAENEYVRATFGNYGGNGQAVWIGLRDTVTEGTFVWADGTPLGYTSWSPGEPNNIGNEDYVSMNDPVTGGWNDQPGGGPLSGVIEVNGSCVLGDMNCSGTVTVADIPLFVSALLGTPNFPGCNINLADINGDTLRNGRDIKPFVALLTP